MNTQKKNMVYAGHQIANALETVTIPPKVMQQNRYTVETTEMTMPRDTRVRHSTVIVASNRPEAWKLGEDWLKELTAKKGVGMSGLSVRRQIKQSTKGTHH